MKARGPSGWIAAIVTAAVIVTAGTGCGDLSREELSRGVQSLGSLAAQGGLIADGVARDDTKATYTRVMAQTLGGEAEHEAEKLSDATPDPRFERQRDAAVEVAGEISELFSQLQTFPGDEKHGALVRRHMGEAREKADAIVERLEAAK